MGRELRDGLAFLQEVAVAVHFLPRVAPDLDEAEALGLSDLLERLGDAEPARPESWQLLGRLLRHLVSQMEDQGDPSALLLRELHRTVMAHVDRTAASARQKEEA